MAAAQRAAVLGREAAQAFCRALEQAACIGRREAGAEALHRHEHRGLFFGSVALGRDRQRRDRAARRAHLLGEASRVARPIGGDGHAVRVRLGETARCGNRDRERRIQPAAWAERREPLHAVCVAACGQQRERVRHRVAGQARDALDGQHGGQFAQPTLVDGGRPARLAAFAPEASSKSEHGVIPRGAVRLRSKGVVNGCKYPPR